MSIVEDEQGDEGVAVDDANVDVDLTTAFIPEARPGAVVDALPFGVWRLDRDGRLTFCNEAYLNLNGFEPEEPLGKTVFELHDEVRALRYSAVDEYVMSNNTTYVTVEERNRREPGLPLFVEVTKSPLHDDHGTVVGMQGALIDITERKLLDDTARFLAHRSGRSGEASFFESIATYLSEALESDYVGIAKVADDRLSVEMLAVVIDHELRANIAYELFDTPCGEALGQDFCLFASGLGERFPRLESLVPLGMQSYIGVTLWSSDGQPIGLIAMMNRRPLATTRLASARLVESVLNMVALRAGGELERRNAEADLQRSEARWRSALEGVGDGMWDWDMRSNTIYRSPRLHEMIGLGPDALGEGATAVLDLVHPDDRSRVLEERARCINGNSTTYSVESRLRCKDGTWKWFLQRGMAVEVDDSGRALRMVGTQIDITERKLAEQRRIVDLTMRRVISAASPLAFFVVDDRTDEIRYFDRQFFTMWGIEDLYERAVAGTVKGVELYDACGERVAHPDEIHARLTPLHYEDNRDIVDLDVLLLDGRTLRIHSAPVRGEDDQYFGRLYMHEDVSERTRAEEAKRERDRWFVSIVESSLDAIFTVDEDERVITFNGAAWEMFGAGQSKTQDRILSEFLPARFRDGASRFLKSFFAGDDRFAIVADRDGLVGRSDDGREFPVEGSLTKMEIGGRTLVSIVVRDLSERRSDEARRQALETRLRVSQRMEAIGHLASGVAHDFNNILGAIYGYTDLARADAEGNEAVLDSLDELSKASRRAAALVRQIHAFSRPEETTRAPLHLGPLVREALGFLRAASPATVEIELSAPDDLRMIVANPTQIHQVVMNLATNGVQAMAERPGRLAVSLANVSNADATIETLGDETSWALPPEVHEGEWVRLAVSDTGHGMDRSELERIFDPFYTTKRHGEGLGLGLAVVHRVVRDCGGVIEVHSDPRIGTRFDAYFPASTVVRESKHESASEIPRGQGECILYVDDEVALGTFGKRSLETLGYAVQAESRSLAALATFRSDPTRFDLVVSDLTMPDLHGIELAKAVHELRPELPVVLMSGNASVVSGQAIEDARVVATIEKPFSVDDLARIVATALRTRLLPARTIEHPGEGINELG